jgi:hypothetical protein
MITVDTASLPCARGTYVLDGGPVTRTGRFGPGNIVIIANEPFEIHYA